jgi:hypothetical protein
MNILDGRKQEVAAQKALKTTQVTHQTEGARHRIITEGLFFGSRKTTASVINYESKKVGFMC